MLVNESMLTVLYISQLSLPYPIDDSKGEAKFDKSKRRLTITLSVIPVTMSQKDLQAANETTFTGDGILN